MDPSLEAGLIGGVAAVIGGIIGAGATVWATIRTMKNSAKDLKESIERQAVLDRDTQIHQARLDCFSDLGAMRIGVDDTLLPAIIQAEFYKAINRVPILWPRDAQVQQLFTALANADPQNKPLALEALYRRLGELLNLNLQGVNPMRFIRPRAWNQR
ncbi:MAG TPA: hypothetical protein VN709_10830 [Terriglobales bacterium]|nr:hypothetical protein [Terriglobales bacterium]